MVIPEAKAIKRLSRSPPWVWVAIAPVPKLLVALDVGERTQAMAQRVVHHVAQVLAPDCAPLLLTDGVQEYLTALLTHYGQWVQPKTWLQLMIVMWRGAVCSDAGQGASTRS
jgi:hypothetical protein